MDQMSIVDVEPVNLDYGAEWSFERSVSAAPGRQPNPISRRSGNSDVGIRRRSWWLRGEVLKPHILSISRAPVELPDRRQGIASGHFMYR
jgi:hypothetical protein